MRPARQAKKTTPAPSKGSTNASSQGRRDGGGVTSKSQTHSNQIASSFVLISAASKASSLFLCWSTMV